MGNQPSDTIVSANGQDKFPVILPTLDLMKREKLSNEMLLSTLMRGPTLHMLEGTPAKEIYDIFCLEPDVVYSERINMLGDLEQNKKNKNVIPRWIVIALLLGGRKSDVTDYDVTKGTDMNLKWFISLLVYEDCTVNRFCEVLVKAGATGTLEYIKSLRELHLDGKKETMFK